MRNLFDQYDQQENRLSHALAVCLDEDRTLLRGFLAWLRAKPPVSASRLRVEEQTLPGDPPGIEEDAIRRGLPDIVIHDGADWCLLIESKVQSRLTRDQLDRHELTVRRRGFEQVVRVTLTKSRARDAHSTGIGWSDLYEWLGLVGGRSAWAARLRAYLRVAESRFAAEGYLTEGTLTMFDGFHFTRDNPYTYGEGKRLIKLATAELRKDDRLRALGADPKAPGRSAITGRAGTYVWDFIPMKDRPAGGAFTSYPHLTLAVHADLLEVAVTIPNGVIPAVRKRLVTLGREGLIGLNAEIVRKARRITSLGGRVDAYAVQRHYASQRSPATTDARVAFDIRTSQPRGAGRVKTQPEWVELFAKLTRSKRSNVQFGYVVVLPWGTPGLDSRKALGLIVDAWYALEPLLSRLSRPS